MRSMNNIYDVIDYLKRVRHPVKIMEVCGTHTSAIVKSGIGSLISPGIRLVSGPGCPVCVTPTSYIDRLVEIAFKPYHTVLSYGDMLKVRGGSHSLTTARAEGADVKMIYSPFEAIELAKKNKGHKYVVAAVGFETTAPVYALLIEKAKKENIENIALLTSLKTMPQAMGHICAQEEIDGFLCPGHVSSIIGSNAFKGLCDTYKKPFVVSGFNPEHILCSIYEIIRQIENGTHEVKNFYPSSVTPEGNLKAQAVLKKYFEPADAVWRGIGIIPDSGLILRREFKDYDFGGSYPLQPENMPKGCSCSDVILGRLSPPSCPFFGNRCVPENALGPCMVSSEGACGIWYENRNRQEA